MSLCQSLFDVIANYQLEREEQIIKVVTISVGPLSGVEPTLFVRAFNLLKGQTIGEQAVLRIDVSPIKVVCKLCGSESEVSANRIICSQCGSWQTTLIEGDQFVLSQIEFMHSR